MKRFVSLLASAVARAQAHIVHTPNNNTQHQVLYDFMRKHFLDRGEASTLSTEEKKRLLHEAIREDDYELAIKFLDRTNLFSKDEYGDTPVLIALADKRWEFLNVAKNFVDHKSQETDAVMGIIAEEGSADTQTEMLGYAKQFFDIE